MTRTERQYVSGERNWVTMISPTLEDLGTVEERKQRFIYLYHPP